MHVVRPFVYNTTEYFRKSNRKAGILDLDSEFAIRLATRSRTFSTFLVFPRRRASYRCVPSETIYCIQFTHCCRVFYGKPIIVIYCAHCYTAERKPARRLPTQTRAVYIYSVREYICCIYCIHANSTRHHYVKLKVKLTDT